MAIATAEFRNTLARLGHSARGGVRRLLGRMHLLSFRESMRVITDAYPDVVEPYIDAAIDLTVQWYDEQPTTGSVFVPQPIDPPDREVLGRSGRWAMTTDDPVGNLGEHANRQVFQASRDTVLDNVIREDGTRWAREARADACPFCKILTTRGAVYWSEASALSVVGRTPNLELGDRRQIHAGGLTRAEAMARRQKYRSWKQAGKAGKMVGEFRVGALRGTRQYGEKYHDDCYCVAVPIRPGGVYVPPDYAESWERDYSDAIAEANKHYANKGQVGKTLSMNDIVNAWNRNERKARGLKKPGPKPKQKPDQGE